MESSLFTNHIVDKTRVNYYFDTYQYKMKFDIMGIHYFRNIRDDAHFDIRLKSACVYYPYGRFTNVKNINVNEIVGSNDQLIRIFLKWIKSNKDSKSQLRTVISFDCVTVYFNDPAPLEKLIDSFIGAGYDIEQLAITLYKAQKMQDFERDVIYHLFPKKKYRLYFSCMMLSTAEKGDFITYVQNNSTDIVCSNRLNDWTTTLKSRIIQSYYYIDMDDDTHVTYLILKFPGLVRKLSNIQKRINTVE